MTEPVLIRGDCMEWLPRLPDGSVDACVTDPPYHLSTAKRFGAENAAPAKSNGATGVYKRASAGFMGQQWDGGDIAFRPEVWAGVLRVLKPGGHLVAFGGSRTYHRLACAVEDAGFEIRDQIMWLYGSGFPKSHNQKDEWEGWGTALKPAHEPIVLARKPFRATVAKNLAEHGCGALNIDGCRIAGVPWKAHVATGLASEKFFTRGAAPEIEKRPHDEGRWPANVCHDGSDEVLAGFPDSKGQQGDVRGSEPSGKTKGIFGDFAGRAPSAARNDTGSAARFFYCAKANRKDRNEGLDESFVERPLNWSSGAQNPGSFQSEGTKKASRNNHPTVKPTALMQWLCRLVTPPGGVVLDPFMGSGSTGKAATREGFGFIGIEQDEKYMAIAKARVRT